MVGIDLDDMVIEPIKGPSFDINRKYLDLKEGYDLAELPPDEFDDYLRQNNIEVVDGVAKLIDSEYVDQNAKNLDECAKGLMAHLDRLNELNTQFCEYMMNVVTLGLYKSCVGKKIRELYHKIVEY